MSKEQVYRILEDAWAQPSDQRKEWVRNNCADEAIRSEVESLLAADCSAGDFLGNRTRKGILDLIAGADQTTQGAARRVGKYRLVRPIARGGMGEVYEAARADGDFEQIVAIKISRRFDLTERRRRRFLEEQRILAQLEHPNIARLIDGGIWEGDEFSEQGRPYLVMEYVDGSSITDFCNYRQLDLGARLSLFQDVCDAVHYAHRNLVIHRDIKPSNILVSEEGRPKLVDFGIATTLEQDSSVAATGTPLMTLDYAAPEQVQRQRITTSTDIYSLGLVLYQLVSNCRAYSLKDRTPAELERLICIDMPNAPSDVAADVPWARRLRGDLDTITLRALAKEPERRYPSARALAEDIQNFLDDLPVAAVPSSRGYRIRKFIARHRWETVTAVAAIFILLTATVTTGVFAIKLQKALMETRTEAQKSGQVVEFMRDLFAGADPLQTDGEVYTLQDVLQSGTRRIDALNDQPEVQGLLLSELGAIHSSLGEYDSAAGMLSRAANIQRRIQDGEESALATTLHRLAIAEDLRGELNAAESAAREALAIRRNASPPDQADIGESMDRLGAVIAVQGRYLEAAPLARAAVDTLLEFAGETDERTLTSMHNLAWLENRLNRMDEAERIYSRVAELSARELGPNDPQTLVSRDAHAVTLRRLGRLDEAEAILRDVLERRTKVLGESHYEVGVTWHNLARLLAAKGRHSEAISFYERTVANWEQSLGPDHPNMGIALSNLGRSQLALGDEAMARETWRRAIEVMSDEPGYEQRLEDTRAELDRLTPAADSG